VTKGDPTVVISAAAVQGWTAEGQVHFCTEVAFAVGARRFIVPSDLAVVAKGDLVVGLYIIRWE